jgi:hypothetical protein
LSNQPRQLVIGRNRRFGNHLRPHHQGSDVTGCLRCLLETSPDVVPETSVSSYNQLKRLIAQEDFIENDHRLRPGFMLYCLFHFSIHYYFIVTKKLILLHIILFSPNFLTYV